jgi:hypothetical protein
MAVNMLINYGSFAVLAVLWLGFGAALILVLVRSIATVYTFFPKQA